jgi:hypothetical protein
MSDKRVFILRDADIRSRASSYVLLGAPADSVVTIRPATRTLEQNAAQWPILQAFAEQLLWPVNGSMVKMTDEEWKDVLTAAFRQETVRLAMGLNGGVVMLGQRTSRFLKSEFSEWLEFLHATAADRGVVVYPEEAPC